MQIVLPGEKVSALPVLMGRQCGDYPNELGERIARMFICEAFFSQEPVYGFIIRKIRQFATRVR